MNAPRIVADTEDCAVVWKPPRMHCAPLRHNSGDTLLEWYAALFPSVLDLAGRKAGEGGLLHRLDYETRGLVLFAKNQRALEFLQSRQEAGGFVKEYHAVCAPAAAALSGFPHPPPAPGFPLTEPFVIASYFRPWGPGRKQVRPAAAQSAGRRESAGDRGMPYRTEIINAEDTASFGALSARAFTIRLKRGFRHQIRCHLAWIGFPIVNDPLYAPVEARGSGGGILALDARALSFPDPRTGELREYRDTLDSP